MHTNNVVVPQVRSGSKWFDLLEPFQISVVVSQVRSGWTCLNHFKLIIYNEYIHLVPKGRGGIGSVSTKCTCVAYCLFVFPKSM